MRKIFIIAGCLLVQTAVAQEESKPTVSWNAYLETYYQFDFNKPADNNRPAFLYSHNRHNEFNLNLGFIKGTYNSERGRANLSLAAGTYMNANYTAEPGLLKNVFEANAGVKISKKKNLWLDAGILPSHIGFESAISKDCWNLTRSILAENSPYFEAGARLSYTTDNGQWMISALALNGWQRITRLKGNSLISWGTQLQYKPTENLLINYSTFLGTDSPDSTQKIRFFQNCYASFNVSKKWGLLVGIDVGLEDKSSNRTKKNGWYAPIVIVKYSIDDHWTVAARGEYYADNHQVIITTGTPNGFQTAGYSINLDYGPVKNILIRLEARSLNSKDPIFIKNNQSVSSDCFITSSIAVNF